MIPLVLLLLVSAASPDDAACLRVKRGFVGWQADHASLVEKCRGLPCVDDPAQDDPAVGICRSPASSPDDCAGLTPTESGGCPIAGPAGPTVPTTPPRPKPGSEWHKLIVFTGELALDPKNTHWIAPSLTAGFLVEPPLGSSVEGDVITPSAFFGHVGVEAGAHVTSGRPGIVADVDVGGGWNAQYGLLSRVVLIAASRVDGTDLGRAFIQTGPAVYIELMNNGGLTVGYRFLEWSDRPGLSLDDGLFVSFTASRELIADILP